MTDTQEAMREDGNGEPSEFAKGYVAGAKAATAQSAEKIARLEAAVLNQMIFRAAAELSNKQLREALFAAQGFIHNGIELGYVRMPDADTPDPAHETPRIIAEALIQQPSTEALDAYVAEKMSALTARNSEARKLLQQMSDLLKKRSVQFTDDAHGGIWTWPDRANHWLDCFDAAPLPPAPEKE